jgi:hypothetical protein
MTPAHLNLLDSDEAEESSHRSAKPTLVSLHFISLSLRRRWFVCVLFAIVGLLAATAFLVASPQVHVAQTTLVLSHDSDADSSHAMSTDASLLTTRTVATKTIANLGLAMTPDEFHKGVKVEPVSSELMSVTLRAPSDAEAIRRLTTLTTTYLAYRGEQLTLQSTVLVNGMQQRIEELQGKTTDLSRRIEQQVDANSSTVSTLSDLVEQRSYVQGQIDDLRQSVEDARLRNTSLIASSRVIDPAATDSGGLKRRIVLILASGLIGGAALGCGTVLFFAIISDRLRRRSDVAAALEVPVRVSVGKIAPLAQPWRALPYFRTLNSRRSDECRRLADAIQMELPSSRQSGRLGVVCLDNAEEVSFAVATAATNLTADGCSVAVIDLTKQSSFELGESFTTANMQQPTVLRPRGIPVLARGVADLRVVGDTDGPALSLDQTDVILAVADLDPSAGADYLLTWTDRVLIAVTAGRSSAEMVRTAADLVRTAGLELRLAALLHTESTDDSSGTAGHERPLPVPIQATAPDGQIGEEQSAEAQALAAEQAANKQEDQTTAIDEPLPEEQLTNEEHATADSTAELEKGVELEHAAFDEQASVDHEQPAAEEQIAAEQAANLPEQPADHTWAPAEPDHTAEEETSTEQEQADAEELTSDPEQSAAEEPIATEQAANLPEQPADHTWAPSEPDHTATEEETSTEQEQADAEELVSDQEQPAEEETSHKEQAVDEEHAAEAEIPAEGLALDQKLADFLEVKPAFEEPSIDGDPTVLVATGQGLGGRLQEQTIPRSDDEFDWNWDWALENSDSKDDGSVIGADDEVLPEPDEIAEHHGEHGFNGWYLYLDAYPIVQVSRSVVSADEEPDWASDWELNHLVSYQDSEAVSGEASATSSTNGRERG